MATRPPKYPLIRYLKVESAYTAQVKSVLEQAAKELDAQILALGSSGNPLTQLQLRAQQASIKAHLRQDFGGSIQDIIREGQKAAASDAVKVIGEYEKDLLSALGNADYYDDIVAAEAQRSAAGINKLMSRYTSSYKPLSQRVYKANLIANGQIDQAVNVALVKGLSAREFAKSIRDLIDPKVPGGVSYAAMRTARTEINNANHAASQQRYIDSKIVEAVDWHLSTSHPEGDLCDSLVADSPYKVDEVPEKPHPQCLCYTTPSLPGRKEFLERLMRGDYGDEAWVEPAKESAKGFGDINSDSVKEGMRSAESARQSMAKQMYDSKGNYNSAKGWDGTTNKAWTSYTELGNKDINALLRNPKAFAETTDAFWVDQAGESVKGMDKLLSKNQLANDITVARGVTVAPGFNPGSLKVGQSFADPAYLSTTSNIDEALDFASGRGAGAEGWTFITKAPKGTNAIAGADYQNEIIFKSGQLQTVVGVDAKNRIIYTEMVP